MLTLMTLGLALAREQAPSTMPPEVPRPVWERPPYPTGKVLLASATGAFVGQHVALLFASEEDLHIQRAASGLVGHWGGAVLGGMLVTQKEPGVLLFTAGIGTLTGSVATSFYTALLFRGSGVPAEVFVLGVGSALLTGVATAVWGRIAYGPGSTQVLVAPTMVEGEPGLALSVGGRW